MFHARCIQVKQLALSSNTVTVSMNTQPHMLFWLRACYACGTADQY